MKTDDILFAFASICAALAGVSEISSVHKRWLLGESQNYRTPLFMVFVKLFRIPKYISIARMGGGILPLLSSAFAALIWLTALVFTLIPLHKKSGKD